MDKNDMLDGNSLLIIHAKKKKKYNNVYASFPLLPLLTSHLFSPLSRTRALFELLAVLLKVHA